MIMRDKKLIKKGQKTEKVKLAQVIGQKEQEHIIFLKGELQITE